MQTGLGVRCVMYNALAINMIKGSVFKRQRFGIAGNNLALPGFIQIK